MRLKNPRQLRRGLQNRQSDLGKALNSAASDFRSRAPGWISKEVRKVYGVDTSGLNSAKKGVIKNGTTRIGGVPVNNYQVVYQGRPLTPTHFKMTPKVRPDKKYVVKASIFKGSKKTLRSDAFLAGTGGSSGQQIPFYRESNSRYPIKSIKTLSVPQMVTSDNTSDTISNKVKLEFNKRLEYQIRRYNGR